MFIIYNYYPEQEGSSDISYTVWDERQMSDPEFFNQMDFSSQGLEPMPSFAPPGYQEMDMMPQAMPSPGMSNQSSFGQNIQNPFWPQITPGPSRPPFAPPGQSQQQRFRRCLFRISVVTLNSGNSFWFYPTEIRRNSLIGYRWRRNRWEPNIIDINRISFIQCS